MAQPPKPQQIVVSDKKLHGPIHAVPCPWCGKPNDNRNLDELITTALEPGTTYVCDYCNHVTVVTKVVVVKVLEVKQSKTTATVIPPPPPPGTALKPR